MNKEEFFDDFDKLVYSIRSYISDNPQAKIVQNDRPLQLLIGYVDENSGKGWYIKSKHLINARKLIKTFFQTSEGKENLLKSFTNTK